MLETPARLLILDNSDNSINRDNQQGFILYKFAPQRLQAEHLKNRDDGIVQTSWKHEEVSRNAYSPIAV